MTKVTTTYRGALHSLNAMPLRGEGDPGEPYPLNNSPFPNSPGSHHLREVVFSHVFSTIFTGNVSFTIAPEVSHHAADPRFWGAGGTPESIEKATPKRIDKKCAKEAAKDTQVIPKRPQKCSQNAPRSALEKVLDGI